MAKYKNRSRLVASLVLGDTPSKEKSFQVDLFVKTYSFSQGDLGAMDIPNGFGDNQLHYAHRSSTIGNGYGSHYAIEWVGGNGYGDGWASGHRPTELGEPLPYQYAYQKRYGDGTGNGNGASDLISLYNISFDLDAILQGRGFLDL